MKKIKSFLAIVMALAMTLSLAACGGKQPTTTQPASTESSSAPSKEIVTLKWVTVGSGMPANYDAWSKKINEYIGEKIGVHVDVEVVPWGDWDTRRNVVVNTSGDYDILFANSGTYNNDVAIGAFLDLTEMVQKNAPDLYKMVPKAYWDACEVNGKIYAVPTYKDSSQSEFFVWDKELAKSAGVDTASINELPELTEAFKLIHDKTSKSVFTLDKSDHQHVLYMYDNMSTSLPTMGVRYDDKKAQIVSVFEQEDIQGYLKLLRDWYQKGYINADAATKPEQQAYRPFGIATGWSGAATTTWGPRMGVAAEAYQWGPTIVSNDTVRGSLNCISANCKYPEKALELLQLVNLDTYVRDAFYYGLEGEDWEYTSDNKVHRIKTEWKMAGYTQGTFFTVTPTDDVEFNQWDEVKTLNEKAKPSVLLGFTLDTEPIIDDLANCVSIYTRYRSEILTGTTDPAQSVPAMMKEMREAGFDKIVAEAQKQVDAFMATK